MIGPAGVLPWTHLVSVRTRIVEEPVDAASLTRLASGAVVADFGKVYAAVPTVTFRHGVAGRLVTMHAGYLLDPQPVGTGRCRSTHGTQHTDMSYTYVQRGGVEQFHPFDYLGFRYFQIDDPGETLTPDDVVASPRHAAVPDEHAATFSSSDPTIDAIFELGRHSALFTAQEQFIDTPTREKGPWLWDGFNESKTAMAAFGEQNLTRKSLLEFAQSQGRYWPNGAVNKIYPDRSGRRSTSTSSPRSIPNGYGSTGCTPATARCSRQVYPVLLNLSDYVKRSIDRSTGLVTSLPATNVYYDFPIVTRHQRVGSRRVPAGRRRRPGTRPAERRRQTPTRPPTRAHRRDQRTAHPPRRHLRRRAHPPPRPGPPSVAGHQRVRARVRRRSRRGSGRGRRVRGEASGWARRPALPARCSTRSRSPAGSPT